MGLMQKLLLSKEHVFDLVQENRYRPENPVLARCIDGRYKASPALPALAFPGGDAGELLVLFSAGRSYGFEIDRTKAWEALVATVGGVKKLGFHTDTHAASGVPLAGCGHIKQISLDPGAYNVDADDVAFTVEAFAKAVKEGARETVLEGEHEEGALLLIRGDWGVYPRHTLLVQSQKKQVSVFEFQQTLSDRRHRTLAEKLVETEAVIMHGGADTEYLYEVLSEVTESHLLETAKRLGKGAPVYDVVFDKGGTFEVIEMGEV